jgi:hypothetical protein
MQRPATLHPYPSRRGKDLLKEEEMMIVRYGQSARPNGNSFELQAPVAVPAKASNTATGSTHKAPQGMALDASQEVRHGSESEGSNTGSTREWRSVRDWQHSDSSEVFQEKIWWSRGRYERAEVLKEGQGGIESSSQGLSHLTATDTFFLP